MHDPGNNGLDEQSDLSKRILIVDDNEDFAHTLAVILGQWGHRTSIAYDGVTALQKSKAFAPDVVILDIRMPDIDGYETAKRFRQTLFGRTLLIISVSGENITASAGSEIDYHMAKPLDFKVLKRILESSIPE